MGFGDYEYALKFRDNMKALVRELLEQERPQPKIGRVVDIDRASGIAYVVYPGNDATSAKVKIYPGTQPLNSDRINGDGNGSVVRVAGPLGSRYVTEVLSTGRHLANPRLYRPSIAGGGSGDTSIRQMIGFNADTVPPADASIVQVAQYLFPKSCGRVLVYTELSGGGDSFAQMDAFIFDKNTTQGAWQTVTGSTVSSTGMDLTVRYFITPDPGGLVVDVGLSRAATSTRTPENTGVQIDCYGWDASLVSIGDTFT